MENAVLGKKWQSALQGDGCLEAINKIHTWAGRVWTGWGRSRRGRGRACTNVDVEVECGSEIDMI